jgi:hypothetical protein
MRHPPSAGRPQSVVSILARLPPHARGLCPLRLLAHDNVLIVRQISMGYANDVLEQCPGHFPFPPRSAASNRLAVSAAKAAGVPANPMIKPVMRGGPA